MENRSYVVYVAVLCLLAAVSEAVVWGPRERGEILPKAVEIPDASEESLSAAAAGMGGDPAKRLYRRQTTTDDGIGYTTPLNNDPHSFALVHWTGYPSEALFILTRRRTRASGYRYSDQSWLWRSLNYGHSFVNDTYKWDNDTVAEWYYISAYSEYLIFADRIHNRLYITFDEGNTYNRSNILFRPDKLTFQSRYANHSMDAPYNMYVLGYDSQNRSLWVSVNLGVTWRKLSDNVVENRYYWRRLTGVEGLATVYFEKNITMNESQLYVVPDVSIDPPELFDPALGNFMKNTFVLEMEYLFVQKADSGSGGVAYSSPLWVSHNRGNFKQARFPLQTVERHYSVVDASEGQVFIAVYHDINNTNLYLSEEQGLNYSLSLEYIISPPERDWTNGYPRFDVHVVEGIVGTYMANQKVPGSSYGASVISYDKGGEWVRLIPPALDYKGTSQICVPPSCSLHLHMDSDVVNGYQSILSQDSAVGLLMAQGNLGSSLSGSRSSVRLYFSRDGGFTWFEVNSGFWEFQFAALGSVIVTVRKRAYTNTIKWSCDEGRSWQTDTFTDTAFGVVVIGMLTEREEKARHVTIFGYRTQWLIIDLNFTSVVPDLCEPDDYFAWLPTDDRPGSRCLLGEVITYERRNSTACCYIDPEYERPVQRTPCQCSIEDFECDFGFQRLSLNSPCTPLPWILWPPPPPSTCDPDGGTYNISSGYRRVAGDKCVRGEEDYFFEQERPCPVLPPQGLLISFDVQSLRVNRSISFSLQQVQGGKKNTTYLWSFNDTTAPVNVTGFSLGSSQSHTFTSPGHFLVSVVASNNGGSSKAVTLITLNDTVNGSSIVPPIQARSDNSVPTGIQLIFKAKLTTLYSTDMFGEVTFEWNFDDGSIVTTTDDFTNHTYRTANNYTVSLRIYAQFSHVRDSTYQLTVYESAKHVQIVSDGLYSSHWVQVGANASFNVEKLPSYSESIPPETFYTWHLVPANGLQSLTRTGRVFSFSFPRYGSYDLSVVGNHSAGSFSTQLTLNAEYFIGKVNIAYIPTVRAGGQEAVANITLYTKKGDPISGTFSYHFLGEDGDNFTSIETLVTDGVASLQFVPFSETVTQSTDVSVTLKVWNHISNSTGKNTVGVVVPGDYGNVRLEFALSSLPSNFNSSTWMAALKEGITTLLESYSVSSILIEIESTVIMKKNDESAVTSATPDQTQRNHNILKRSEAEQVLVVNVNILPKYASTSNISLVKDVANQLASNGTVVVTVGGVQYTVDIVVGIMDHIIIVPAQTVYVNNWKLYSGIGGGLGVVLFLGVAVSVGLAVIIYYYRRRYNRLRVRYSRLSQAPVRFTFTQSGDMMEEEDPDINAEDTACGETDDDSQPLKQMK